MKALLPLLFLTLLCTSVRAQPQQGVAQRTTFPTPVNDIVPERTNMQRRALPQPPLREADILWQKEVYRIIDVSEKMNHHFNDVKRPLINILLEAADSNHIQLYSALNNHFNTLLTTEEQQTFRGGIDTLMIVDPFECMSVTFELVPRELNPNDIRHYYLREAWYVDKNSGKMKVRLLGIAPVMDELDENGNVLSERALFWVYYPATRKTLAQEWVFLPNEAAARTWADVFDSRQFASYAVEGLRPD